MAEGSNTPELENPEPKWEIEKSQIETVLFNVYKIKPKSAELRNISLLAKGIYGQSRETAQPFLDNLFDDGYQKYFQLVSASAVQLNREFNPKVGDPLPDKSLEQLMEDKSTEVVLQIADMLDTREKLESEGLSEILEKPEERFEDLLKEEPELIQLVGRFEKSIKDAKEAGANQDPWLIGLRSIQATLHKQLANLDKMSHGTASGKMVREIRNGTLVFRKEIIFTPENSKLVHEGSDQLAMGTIDGIERALPNINKYEWRNTFQAVQNSFIDFLDSRGIRRLIPKVGENLDPTWQMGMSGIGEKITRVYRGAFVNKSDRKVIQEAQVEVGV